MPKEIEIIIPQSVQKGGVSELFGRVYSDYKGTLFSSPVVEISAEGFDKPIEIRVQNGDFSQIDNYKRSINTFWLNSRRNPRLRIIWNGTSYPTIRFDTYILYGKTEDEAAKARKSLEDILSFALLVMKYSGASYFYGGYEIHGKITDEGTCDVELISCKGKEYVKMLQTHVKKKFDIFLQESQIERIVKETARIERRDGFTTVYFFDITAGGLTDNRFYMAVKELARKQT